MMDKNESILQHYINMLATKTLEAVRLRVENEELQSRLGLAEAQAATSQGEASRLKAQHEGEAEIQKE